MKAAILSVVSTVSVVLSAYIDSNGITIITEKLDKVRNFDMTSLREDVVCSTICISGCKPLRGTHTVVTCNKKNAGCTGTNQEPKRTQTGREDGKTEGKNIHTAREDTTTDDKNIHAEGEDTKTEGKNVHSRRGDTKIDGKNVHTRRGDTRIDGKNIHAKRGDTKTNGKNIQARRKDSNTKSRKKEGRGSADIRRKEIKGTHARSVRNNQAGHSAIHGKKKRKRCLKYGKKIKLLYGKKISGNNHKDIIHTTIKECGRKCINLKEFFCKSFDFRHVINSCSLSRYGYFDVPKSHRKHGQPKLWTHGLRVCEVR